MTTKETGGPAFPTLDYITPDRVATNQEGMTLRDYFAAKALPTVATGHMQGYTDNDGRLLWYLPSNTFTSVAADAYAMADAMLAVRDK